MMKDAHSTQVKTLFDLPVGPGTPFGKGLSFVKDSEYAAVFRGTVPVYYFSVHDNVARKVCMATLSVTGAATDIEIADMFKVHRNTVGRYAKTLLEQGVVGLVPETPRPWKVTAEIEAVIRGNLELGAAALTDIVGQQTGVELSSEHVRRLRLQALREIEEADGAGSHAVAGADATAEAAAAMPTEPCVVGAGTRVDPDSREEPPIFLPELTRGRHVGVALFYPALAALGLLDAAQKHYRLPGSERFGVQAVFSTLFFLTLLGKTTMESAKHLVRRSFGAVIGTERAPCVKTIRRKVRELAQHEASAELGVTLGRKWLEAAHISPAYLYVDGHIKTYSGKRKLSEFWNAQRRMPLPGVVSYYVGDQGGRPLLVMTGELDASLSNSMREIVRQIRHVVGDRRFTVIFDRGGYDGQLFEWIKAQGIDFITYQRGSPGLARERFSRREARFGGARRRFWVAEDEVTIAGTGPWRRIVIRTPKDEHQTPILTSLSRQKLPSPRVACMMFARWRQENFFKYMKEHHGLDELNGQDWEPRPDDLVPNPERKRMQREIRYKRRQAANLESSVATHALLKPMPGSQAALEAAHAETLDELRTVQREVRVLEGQFSKCPEHVPARETDRERAVMKLEPKRLIDSVKMTAYNAEEWTLERLRRHYHNSCDARDLLRSFTRLSGEIRTNQTAVIVTLDPPDTPLHRKALRGLCADLNGAEPTYPGTKIPVEYRVAVHHSEV